MLENLPQAGTVMAAGEYLQRFTTCERYSIDSSAPDDDTIRDLSASGLLILNCNPNFQPQGDVSTAPALIDGCVLTDEFVQG